jgi:hypothetical protein
LGISLEIDRYEYCIAVFNGFCKPGHCLHPLSLLDWHKEDPVDAVALQHHLAVSAHQNNRNPFIDHPEWVACVFEDDCPVFPLTAGLNGAHPPHC